MLHDFTDGLNAYFTALKLVRRLRLWPFLLIPGIISLLFGGAVFLGANALGVQVAQYIMDHYPWESGAQVVRRIARFLGTLIVWAGAIMLYKYIILILVAPFMSPLSEKVEKYIRGGAGGPRFSIPGMIRDMIRGIRISLRNILRELGFTLALILFGMIPVVGLVSPLAIFLVQAYYAGFGNMDYTLERHFRVRGSVEFVRDYKGLAIANGAVYLLLLAVPVVGLFLAPSLATIAGAVETVERLEHDNLRPIRRL